MKHEPRSWHGSRPRLLIALCALVGLYMGAIEGPRSAQIRSAWASSEDSLQASEVLLPLSRRRLAAVLEVEQLEAELLELSSAAWTPGQVGLWLLGLATQQELEVRRLQSSDDGAGAVTATISASYLQVLSLLEALGDSSVPVELTHLEMRREGDTDLVLASLQVMPLAAVQNSALAPSPSPSLRGGKQ